MKLFRLNISFLICLTLASASFSTYALPPKLVLASSRVQETCNDAIKKLLGVVRKLEKYTGFDNRDEIDIIHNDFMPDVESKAIAEAKKIGGIPGGVRFNEVIDESLRELPEVSKYLLELALRRLPYLKNQEFNIILSGGVADVWAEMIQKDIAEIEQRVHRKLKINIIKFPGGLSSARKIRRDLPALDSNVKNILKEFPSIFLDDTYSNGGTAEVIKKEVTSNGGNFHGTFVAYDGGKGDAASLYKSARINTRSDSMGNFSFTPDDWNPLRLKKVGIEIDGALFVANENRLSLQAEKLLKWIEDKQLEVVFINRNGQALDDLDKLNSIKRQFPYLFISEDYKDASVLIGSFGRLFVGDKKYLGPRFNGATIQTLYIGDFTTHGQFDERQLDKNYLLNRLAEANVISPEYPSVSSQTPLNSHGISVFDQRNKISESEQINLDEIYATKDRMELVSKIKWIEWQKLTIDQKQKVLEMASRSNNSFEIGAYIEIAKNSNDKAWTPLLTRWESQWQSATSGWQKFFVSQLRSIITKLK